MFVACFVITEFCNMGCEYCYMKNKRNSMMKPEVFDYHYETTLPHFMEHYNHDTYRLDLFGGEPTTYWKMIYHIVDKVKGDPKLDSICMPTNGLNITEKDVGFLKENIKVSLSFDGLWAENFKLYLNKKHIFKQLVDKCSVCVTPDHMNMSENFEFLLREFGLIPKFKIVRDNIWDEASVEQFKLELDKLEVSYFSYLDKGLNIFPFEQRLLMMLESQAHQMSKLRCFVGHKGVAFGSNKKVYPCARFLTDDYYPIYDGKELTENLEIIDDFAKSFTDGCKQCEISAFCGNMCLHQEMEHGMLKNVCDINIAIAEKIADINHKLKDNEIWKKYIKRSYYGQK